MKACYFFFLLMVMLSACVGTDLKDDPIIGERIEVSRQQVALQSGQNVQLMAEYYDQYGISRLVLLNWSSSDPQVASVDQTGLVQAIAPGQSIISTALGEITGPLVNVNVIDDEDGVATVTVAASQTNLNIGESVLLTAKVQNIRGEVLTGNPPEWFSENSAIVQVNAQGQVTALANGIASVHAKVNGVKSNSLDLTVGAVLLGEFVPAGGYIASGTVMLRMENEQLILDLGNNFQTSFALGTYIYLANSTNASNVRSLGLEVAQVKKNGAKTFNVSAINPNVGLFDYRYVVILCKPATVTFGYADLTKPQTP